MYFINWKKNLFIFLYFVLFITSFSIQHQQMCAEFWIQNKDLIAFSTKKVVVVRKRILSAYFFNLFILFNRSFHKVIAMKITGYCIKTLAIILMLLLKKLNNQMLEIGIKTNVFEFNLSDLIGDTHFNIKMSVFTKNHFEETINAQSSKFNCIDVEYETISYRQEMFHTESKALSIAQPASKSKPSEPVIIIVSIDQESKLHPSIMKKFYDSLNEKDRRRYAALESMRIGHGGQTYISKILGCDRKTIRKGMKEIKNFPRKVKYDSRIRIRKRRNAPPDKHQKKIDKAFLAVMENYKAGDPMKDGQLWTNLSRPVIAKKIYEKVNIKVSDHCVKQLLKKIILVSVKCIKN
ncbi:MAG: hypothetical protein OMM_02664 [Candidatus Magnetoglobus multicellularis str. Araruama]|uniref:Uncharacterized protein n=1 Tax=Candidatus Magnetoglobus multicellularis str. Araruama TaxID=890399 RepID=A0A1V1P8V5_9BACT|nr:MAG: hypothetical protein OMM_02664 [Candidatus Magnetoglobus multicellularis str. Araruama]